MMLNILNAARLHVSPFRLKRKTPQEHAWPKQNGIFLPTTIYFCPALLLVKILDLAFIFLAFSEKRYHPNSFKRQMFGRKNLRTLINFSNFFQS